MKSGPPLFHLWLPGIGETGGIQHYSACLLQALEQLYPEARLCILAKNDRPDGSRTNGRHRVIRFGHLPSLLRTLAFSWQAVFMAWRDRPTACIATHPHFAKLLGLLPFPSTVPVLAAAHGIEIWGHLYGLQLAGIKACRGLLPVSQFTQKVMLDAGALDPDKVLVVPDTFRQHAFATGPKPDFLLQRHGLRPDQPVILTVGRLAASEAYKGQDHVIQSLPAIRRVLPDLRYVIVGAGDDEARLRALAETHGQSHAVIFAGFVPENELAAYYRLSDLFVMPSIGEGFGIVYLEALASGRPCIVGNVDASPEAIDHGRLGFIVDPDSHPQIASAVIRFFQRDHDQPWLHDPQHLRAEAIRLYGFDAFKRSLHQALRHLLPELRQPTDPV